MDRTEKIIYRITTKNLEHVEKHLIIHEDDSIYEVVETNGKYETERRVFKKYLNDVWFNDKIDHAWGMVWCDDINKLTECKHELAKQFVKELNTEIEDVEKEYAKRIENLKSYRNSIMEDLEKEGIENE